MKAYYYILPLAIVIFFIMAFVRMTSLPQDKPSSYFDKVGVDLPKKAVIDTENELAYCLSKTGRLFFLSLADEAYRYTGLRHAAWKDITFIEDFCVDTLKKRIYFTDLMDLATGESAIKFTNFDGSKFNTIVVLDNEIPYKIQSGSGGELLYYLAKQSINEKTTYALKFVDLSDGITGTFYKTVNRIEEISIPSAIDHLKEVNTHSISAGLPKQDKNLIKKLLSYTSHYGV